MNKLIILCAVIAACNASIALLQGGNVLASSTNAGSRGAAAGQRGARIAANNRQGAATSLASANRNQQFVNSNQGTGVAFDSDTRKGNKIALSLNAFNTDNDQTRFRFANNNRAAAGARNFDNSFLDSKFRGDNFFNFANDNLFRRLNNQRVNQNFLQRGARQNAFPLF